MDTGYVPKLGAMGGFPQFKISPLQLQGPTGPDFSALLNQMVSGLNETSSKPDALLENLMRGDPNVDIHDVMIANSEAELAINTTTQSLTRLIQAYDRILQIQL